MGNGQSGFIVSSAALLHRLKIPLDYPGNFDKYDQEALRRHIFNLTLKLKRK